MIGIITTIFKPTASVTELVRRLRESHASLTVVGDEKGPEEFKLDGSELLSLEKQLWMPYRLPHALPVGHYARKNVGYLYAMGQGTECIYESDDDNAPLDCWGPRSLLVDARLVNGQKWVNVYRFFTDEFVWPRGLPLNRIQNESVPRNSGLTVSRETIAPIQQGLANNSPDVDAIWRLLYDKPITFDRNPSVDRKSTRLNSSHEP
jgi:hypothetical protein